MRHENCMPFERSRFDARRHLRAEIGAFDAMALDDSGYASILLCAFVLRPLMWARGERSLRRDLRTVSEKRKGETRLAVDAVFPVESLDRRYAPMGFVCAEARAQ
jgi:hypothetical protein